MNAVAPALTADILGTLQSPATFAMKASRGTWQCPAHLELLNERLLDIAAGKCKRLLVVMPPRHGKSEFISKYFPAWYLGMFPTHRIILASYDADFAATWGRRAREIVESEGRLQFVENIEISNTSASAARWDITVRKASGEHIKMPGGMVTAGVRGALTGMGAHVAIIDDPLKNAEQASSETYREGIWEWYKSTLYTRLEPDGAIILVMTRWHEDDLAGRLLKEMENHTGDQWDVLHLPAIATGPDALGRQAGDALWPERYPVEKLAQIELVVGPYDWEALYQGSPAPTEGGLFKRAWFEKVPNYPAVDCVEVRRWDLAGSKKKRADWTSGMRVAYHAAAGIAYIVHLNRLKGDPEEVEKELKSQAAVDGRHVHIRMEQEPGSSGLHTCSYYARHVLPGYDFMGIPSTGSKIDRARNVRSAAAMGRVKIVEGPWNQTFLDEIALFPNGAHDDAVDTLSGAWEDLTGDLFRDPSQDPTAAESTAPSALDTLYKEIGGDMETWQGDLPGL